MMTEKEAAIYLAVAPKTLRQWRCYGKGPPFYRYEVGGGVIRYNRVDLDFWLMQARARSGLAVSSGSTENKKRDLASSCANK
jgi:hypothetical protein